MDACVICLAGKGKTLCNLNQAKGIGREQIPEKGAYFGVCFGINLVDVKKPYLDVKYHRGNLLNDLEHK